MKAAILGHPRKRPNFWSLLDPWSMFSEKEPRKWQDSHGFVMNVFAGCGGGRPIMVWGQEILDSIKSPHRIGLEFTGRNFLEFIWLLFSFVVKYLFLFSDSPKAKDANTLVWPMVVAKTAADCFHSFLSALSHYFGNIGDGQSGGWLFNLFWPALCCQHCKRCEHNEWWWFIIIISSRPISNRMKA